MAEKNYIRSKTVLDPLFPIPQGAEEEFVYEVSTVDVEDRIITESDDIAQDALSEVDADVVEWVDEGVDVSGVLPVPENFTVVSQTIRRAPGGQMVVDVVIEFEEVGGASGYQAQGVKI